MATTPKKKGLPVIGPYTEAIKAVKGCHGVKTSDIVGACYKTDIDSYLKLIVRKITEKCNTNQELMSQIRRVKLSEHSYVTPNEFRYTLLKFGVNLSQPVVDAVFNVFDSDRSGTMDFDEFATWIMNADSRPYKPPPTKGEAVPLTETQILRNKLNADLIKHPNTFTYLRNKISFMELVSDVNRIKFSMSEKDVRALFVLLDPNEWGFIETPTLLHWAKTGEILQPKKLSQATSGDLQDAVLNATGRNPKLIAAALKDIPTGKHVMMTFDEFVAVMLKGGVGPDKKHVKALFMAIGGASGYGDIDKLREFVGPALEYKRQVPEPFKIEVFGASVSKADKRLREKLRVGFDNLKHAVHHEDRAHSGWIDCEKLLKLINKYCGPTSYADFRLVLKNLQVNDNHVNIPHFLQEYNPKKSNVYVNVNPGATEPSKGRKRPSSAGATNAYASKNVAFNEGVIDSTSSNFNNTSSSLAELNATAARGTLRPKSAGASLSANKITTEGVTLGTLGSNRERTEHPAVLDLRRKWQIVLRECQKADSTRCGVVDRKIFLDALVKTDLSSAMSNEFMQKLADTYTMTKPNMVDYLTCFHSYLNELISIMPKKESKYVPKPTTLSRNGQGQHPWDFKYERVPPTRNNPGTPYWARSQHRKQVESDRPSTAGLSSSSSTKSFNSSVRPKSAGHTGLARSKSHTMLSDGDRQNILKNYDQRTITVCSKCHDVFLPIWRSIRNEFKRTQINSKNGCILASTFLAILEHFGVRLSSSELAVIVKSFREFGTLQADVIKYDEFLRVCLVCKPIVSNSKRAVC